MLARLLASSGPVVHIAPGSVLTIDGVSITNSILYGWICAIAIIITLVLVAKTGQR